MALRTLEYRVVLWLAVGTAACSAEHVAVLGGAAGAPPVERAHAIYARSGPPVVDGAMDSSPRKAWKIADRQGPISAFAVVNGQIFWLARGCDGCSERSGDYTSFLTLRSCSASNCADTVAEWEVGSVHNECCAAPEYVAVNDTRVFWPEFHKEAHISTCPRGDCASPARLGFGEGWYEFAVDEARAYFVADGTVASCRLDDCAGTVSRYEMKPPPGERRSIVPPDLLSLDEDHIYLWDGRILRVAKEGADTFEVLAQVDALSSFALREDSMFWTTSTDRPGELYTCPKSGCVGEPREIVAGLSQPSALVVDDRYAYFMENRSLDPASGLYATISRCALDGCDEPELLIDRDQGPRGRIVVDDEYLYFAGKACAPGEDATDPEAVEACDYIGAIRK